MTNDLHLWVVLVSVACSHANPLVVAVQVVAHPYKREERTSSGEACDLMAGAPMSKRPPSSPVASDATAFPPVGDVVTQHEYPHDPANGATHKIDGNPCNRGCPGDWPCEIRREQRQESREVAEYLRSDLYGPVPSGDEGNLWRSPLGWQVWLCYGERTLVGTIRTPDGKPHSSTTHACVQWLQADLP